MLPSPHRKPDMSRLRLAAGCAVLKLAQEPCYHEIITLEQYQLCALVINVREALSLSAPHGPHTPPVSFHLLLHTRLRPAPDNRHSPTSLRIKSRALYLLYQCIGYGVSRLT